MQALTSLVDHSINDLKSVKENLRMIDNDFEVILKEVREEILSHSLVDDVFKKLIVDNMASILDVSVDDTQINSNVKYIEENIEKMRDITENFLGFIKNYATMRRHFKDERNKRVEKGTEDLPAMWPQ